MAGIALPALSSRKPKKRIMLTMATLDERLAREGARYQEGDDAEHRDHEE